MKKLVFGALAVLFFILSACEGNKRCPAYDKLDAVSDNVEILK